jgi:hypothetical protein
MGSAHCILKTISLPSSELIPKWTALPKATKHLESTHSRTAVTGWTVVCEQFDALSSGVEKHVKGFARSFWLAFPSDGFHGALPEITAETPAPSE